jgi:D-glycero-alpha-D-manno-heptose-7-phosphate kinase
MIISRTPFRVSFSGGGTDIQEHYTAHDGTVLSTSINHYMYITVNHSFDDRIRISYSKTEIVYDVERIQHALVRETLKWLGIHKGIEITSIADVPSGTGLGSSSAFTVGLLNALHAFKGEMCSAHQLAEEACQIEIERVGEPIGKQDQFISAYGGLEFITFNRDHSVFVDPVICSAETKQRLQDHLLLFYLGQEQRAASGILEEQKKTMGEKSKNMNTLAQIAKDMKKILEKNNSVLEFGKLLHEAWQIKKSLSDKISNPKIETIYDKALSSGALGGKLLGAGGSGFLLLFAQPNQHKQIQNALSELRECSFAFEPQGSKIIYVS